MHLVKKATPTLFILLNAIKKGTTESEFRVPKLGNQGDIVMSSCSGRKKSVSTGLSKRRHYYLSNFTNFAGSVEFSLKEFWVFVGPNMVLKSNFQNKLIFMF